MIIGWIYPHRERCGIARYATDYASVLERNAEIRHINPLWYVSARERFRSAANGCDIVHLQYDTSAFMHKKKDFFGALIRQIQVPLVVSLHEVYDENPLTFPRGALTGNPLIRRIRQLRWDVRHPVDKAYRTHLSQHFFARHLLVHHSYHKKLLAAKGIDSSTISVYPMPMHLITAPKPDTENPALPLQLGAHGFIQSAYDFDLLIAALQRLQLPWQFTWIGGVRTTDQQSTFDTLTRRIHELGWESRFRITGWLDEAALAGKLAEIDLVLALFKHRSSSASISRALGHGKAVIATELPMTRELADGNKDQPVHFPPLLTVPHDSSCVAEKITAFATDATLRVQLSEGIITYVNNHTFDQCARRLLELYRELLSR